MKKVILFVLLLSMLGSATAFAAVDIEATGKFQFQMNFMDNSDFRSAKDGGSNEDDLNFWFRARTKFKFIVNENLKSELYVEYKDRLGGSTSDLTKGSDDRKLGVKRAFIEFRYPGTEAMTQAGIMAYDYAYGVSASLILSDTDAGGINFASPITENVAVAASYARLIDLYDDDNDSTLNKNLHDELDVFYLAVPLTFDGIEATPYFAYSMIGQDSFDPSGAKEPLYGLVAPGATAFEDDANVWWAGGAFSVNMFDPIIFNADFAYGALDADKDNNDRAGWIADFDLSYTGLSFMKPKLTFAYMSGEDDDVGNGSERMPSFNNDWAIGTYYFGGSHLTSSDLDNQNQYGLWAVGLSFEDISYMDKLSHEIHFVYIQGTNDEDLIKGTNSATFNNISNDGMFLTTDDHAVEVDFNTFYDVYENLTLILEFGYINMNLDNDVWKGYDGGNKVDDAYKFDFGIVYHF